MIHVSPNLWIGDSDDEQSYDELDEFGIGAVLNVAQDLEPTRGWPEVDCMQVGLIDGPGNEVCVYCSAVLALHTLLKRQQKVLVCCHSGSRALAVAIMYLSLKRGKASDHPTFLNCWLTWDKILAQVLIDVDCELPETHRAHREAFDRMPFSLLESLI